MKGLPLAYNRDLQEDKEGFLDTDLNVQLSLEVFTGLLGELSFEREAMRKACAKGFLNATELADYLVGCGLPFRQAHHLTGQAVALAESKGLALEELSLSDLKSISPLIQEEVYTVLDPMTCVKRRETFGGTGPQSVAHQLTELKSWLAQQA